MCACLEVWIWAGGWGCMGAWGVQRIKVIGVCAGVPRVMGIGNRNRHRGIGTRNRNRQVSTAHLCVWLHALAGCFPLPFPISPSLFSTYPWGSACHGVSSPLTAATLAPCSSSEAGEHRLSCKTCKSPHLCKHRSCFKGLFQALFILCSSQMFLP